MLPGMAVRGIWSRSNDAAARFLAACVARGSKTTQPAQCSVLATSDSCPFVSGAKASAHEKPVVGAMRPRVREDRERATPASYKRGPPIGLFGCAARCLESESHQPDPGPGPREACELRDVEQAIGELLSERPALLPHGVWQGRLSPTNNQFGAKIGPYPIVSILRGRIGPALTRGEGNTRAVSIRRSRVAHDYPQTGKRRESVG
jgi:hypothetical protein